MPKPRERNPEMSEFFGKLDRERNAWDIAVVGPAGSALVNGKAGQPAEQVFDLAKRGLQVAEAVSA
jgi:hypothetical protein